MQNDLLNTHFYRGAFVRWIKFDDPEGIYAIFGIIECERTDSPGWYYVRAENGFLYTFYWQDLKLAAAK